MFTGLVREIGVLRAMGPRGGVVRLDIAAPGIAAAARPGRQRSPSTASA